MNLNFVIFREDFAGEIKRGTELKQEEKMHYLVFRCQYDVLFNGIIRQFWQMADPDFHWLL